MRRKLRAHVEAIRASRDADSGMAEFQRLLECSVPIGGKPLEAEPFLRDLPSRLPMARAASGFATK